MVDPAQSLGSATARQQLRITSRPATDADTDFARDVHHAAYRDVVIRQFGTWDDPAVGLGLSVGWAAISGSEASGVPAHTLPVLAVPSHRDRVHHEIARTRS